VSAADLPRNVKPTKTILLTNFVPPYRLPVFEVLHKRLGQFRVLVSTAMERNRAWTADWGTLDVVAQRGFSVRTWWRHPHGFAEKTYFHVPLDTIAQLWRYSPRVVISAEFGIRTLFAALYVKLHRNTRLIVWATLSEYTEQNRGRCREGIRRLLLRCADAVMVNGESGARYIRQFGFPDHHIFRVQQTTDVERFSAGCLDRGDDAAYRLLFVGQLVDRKGVIPLLESLCRLGSRCPDRAIEIWIVGDGPLRDAVEAVQLPPRVKRRMLGSVAYEDLPEIYTACGLFVFPTLADEWGLVVNEALAAGLPVIGSIYAQAVDELITDGENGWRVCPNNPDHLDEAIARALDTPLVDLQLMRKRARESAVRLTASTMADRIVATVSAVCCE
jgi:glycosyltransferase involved in cell wall biosynthesis